MGWRCAVDTAAVRPYWGRALAWFGGTLATLYIAVAVAAFAVLVASGCKGLSPLDTLWPGRWPRVAAARSQYFLRQAQAAFRAGETRQVLVCLTSAAALAPSDYGVHLDLARVYSALSLHAFADREFVRLWAYFPKERENTSIAWHDALIASGRFDALGRLAAIQLSTATGQDRAAWLRALFIALRGAVSPQKIVRENAAFFTTLPPLWPAAIQAEAETRGGVPGALAHWPEIPVRPENATLLILWGESAADTTSPEGALDKISHLGPAVPAFERERLLYRLYARVGREQLARSAFDGMLRLAGRPPQRERLLAALVEFPDAECLARFAEVVSNPQYRFSKSELAELWIAALASNDASIRRLVEQRCRREGVEINGAIPTGFNSADAAVWMRVLPIDREVAYALALSCRRR